MSPMAALRGNPNRIAKIASIFLSVVAAALLTRSAVPYAAGVLLPLWLAVRGWLVPPYLFITVHLIILAIWKLSETRHHTSAHRDEEDEIKPSDPVPVVVKPAAPILRKASPEIWADIAVSAVDPGEIPPESGETSPEPASEASSCLTVDEDERSVASSRFEDKKAAVEEFDEEDGGESLDDTWRAIHLKKSDAWERSRRSEAAVASAAAAAPRVIKKSVTFKLAAPAAVVRGNEGSVVGSEEEWDRLFDAFIKKTKDQINGR